MIVTGSSSWNLVIPTIQTVTRPSVLHLLPGLVDPTAFLSGPGRVFLGDDTVEGSDCSSLTSGEARSVACADGYTAAGDTETTITCVFDPELPSACY